MAGVGPVMAARDAALTPNPSPCPRERGDDRRGCQREIAASHPNPSALADSPLTLPADDWRRLLQLMGPSLGLWRGAEIAALRSVAYTHPVLDLGCGDGLVTSFVLRQVEWGVDPDRAQLERARPRSIHRRLLPVPVQMADLADGSVGTVLSNSVLEHIAPIGEVLATAARLLRPGGLLAFTTPSERFSTSLLLPGDRYANRRNARFQHLNLWSPGRWTRELEAVGLRVERVERYLAAPFVRIWDVLELAQAIRLGGTRLFSPLWRRVPAGVLDTMAARLAALDLRCPEGGGQMIVARKEG